MGSGSDRILVSYKPLREGETICICSALWYDSLPMLEEMLSTGGHAGLQKSKDCGWHFVFHGWVDVLVRGSTCFGSSHANNAKA